VDNPVILKKMESLNRCLNRIKEKRPESLEELKNNWDLQDILSVNLERAVQISVDITAILISERGIKSGDTMAQGFEILVQEEILSLELAEKLKKSVGFRNISVHEYQSIDWALVYNVIHHHLGNFEEFMQALLGVI
jgi:uncharacterized protein YutE (UPF0331/DUF86 family)